MSGNLVNLVDALDDGVFFISPQGVVLLTNSRATSLTGVLRGKTVPSEALRSQLRAIRDDFARLPLEFRLDDENLHRTLAYRIIASPLGEGYMVTVRDVTQEQQLETLVGNFADLLQFEFGDRLSLYAESLHNLASEAGTEAGRLPALVNEARELARQGNGLLARVFQLATLAQTFSHAPVMAAQRLPISELVYALMRRLQPLLDEKEISLRLETGWEEMPVVYGSAPWLIEAIHGYLEHVLGHCRRKTELVLSLKNYGNFVRLQLNNRGMGVQSWGEKDALPFRAMTSQPGEGLGLGLALCQKIVDLYKGHLRVSVEDGEVVSLVLELPVGAPVEDALAEAELDILQARRYAEDLARLMQRQRKNREVIE